MAGLQSLLRRLGPHLLASLAMTSGLLVLDAALRRDTLRAYSPLELRQYALSIPGSVGLWWGLFVLTALPLRRCLLDGLRVVGLLALGGLLLAVPLTSWLTYRRFPNAAAFVFFANEWRFVMRTAGSMVDARPVLVLLGVGGAVGGLTWLSRRAAPTRGQAAAALVGLAAEVAVLGASTLSPSMPLLADGNSVRFLTQLARWRGTPPRFFEVVDRLPPALARAPSALPYNVLWIVHETLGAQYLRTPGGVAVAPNLLGLRDDPSVRWFSRLHAVSSCTDVSVPSILSGVSTAAVMGAQKVVALPFDVARAAGAFTFVSASQRLEWANMRRYLEAEAFDRFKGAEDFQRDADDDSGVSDHLAYQEALAAMDAAVASGKPFMGLLRTNATHGPYQVDPQDSPFVDDAGFGLGEAGGFARYLNSVHYADRLFGDFWKVFAQRDFFERTLVVVTADHGEAFGQHGLWAHCGSFFPEESLVPGALRLPKAWRQDESHAGALRNLEAAGEAFVGTTDLFPTVADLVGWHEALAPQFDGSSWLRPLREERRYVFTNCSDLRGCAIADLGFYEGGLRWVYAGESRSWRAYDEALDAAARNDVAAAHQPELRRALGALEASPREGPIVQRILRR